MKIVQSHELGQAAAKQRITGLAVQLQEQHRDKIEEVVMDWVNEYKFAATISLKGVLGFMVITGVGEISPLAVTLDISLPLLARAYSGQIEQAIRQSLANCLSLYSPNI